MVTHGGGAQGIVTCGDVFICGRILPFFAKFRISVYFCAVYAYFLFILCGGCDIMG